MTREEAIYELKNAAWLGTDHSRARTEEAVEMAIKALEQPKYFFNGSDELIVLDEFKDILSQEPTEKPMCDRNICLSNEYNGIGCDECIVNKAEQEPCDDAISRDMALEKMADYVASGYADSEEDFEEYSRIICQLPSVTQKSGKWIYDETLENWRCSKCNETPKTMGYVGTADFMAEHFKFCNHCGAKMESGDKE